MIAAVYHVFSSFLYLFVLWMSRARTTFHRSSSLSEESDRRGGGGLVWTAKREAEEGHCWQNLPSTVKVGEGAKETHSA
jgi:hypothetical protein